MSDIEYAVRPRLDDAQLNELYAAAWPHHHDMEFGALHARSLTWVTAWRGSRLVGYVYVATDGFQHGFVLNPTVHPDERRRGIGRALVRIATEEARRAGATWLHVDYEPHLDSFYRGCGFRPTTAGLIDLREPAAG